MTMVDVQPPGCRGRYVLVTANRNSGNGYGTFFDCTEYPVALGKLGRALPVYGATLTCPSINSPTHATTHLQPLAIAFPYFPSASLSLSSM
jgi:hypothetical protein